MPFRLPKAIRAVAAATNSDEVLSALQKTTNLNVLAVWPLQLDQVNATDILYHQDIPQKFRQDHQAAIGQFGLSPIVRQAITSPVPFTFSEVRQTLQPRGEEHWIFDLLQDHGFKDGFHCNYGPWILGFWSDRMLGSRVVLSPEGRMTLNASGAVAIHRLKELMQKKTTAYDPKLSARELVVLQHLAQGMRLPAIAERLELSQRTLETYVTSARKKLGAKTSTEAVAIAIRLRLI